MSICFLFHKINNLLALKISIFFDAMCGRTKLLFWLVDHGFLVAARAGDPRGSSALLGAQASESSSSLSFKLSKPPIMQAVNPSHSHPALKSLVWYLEYLYLVKSVNIYQPPMLVLLIPLVFISHFKKRETCSCSY